MSKRLKTLGIVLSNLKTAVASAISDTDGVLSHEGELKLLSDSKKYDLYIHGERHSYVPMSVEEVLSYLRVFTRSGEIHQDALPLRIEITESQN